MHGLELWIFSKDKRSFKCNVYMETMEEAENEGEELVKIGVPEDLAWQAGNSRRGYWFTTHTAAVNMVMTKERLISSGFYDLATAYQSVHVNY